MGPCPNNTPLLFLIALFVSFHPADGKTLYVKTDGNPAGDGLSWETAFDTVSGAIAASASGDQIWVASGTYNESSELNEGLSLFGGFKGMEEDQDFNSRDWKLNKSIIDATGQHSAVIEGASYSTIDGFTISNGANPNVSLSGGGIRLLMVESMEIRNCLIMGNRATPGPPNEFRGRGGGIDVVGSRLKIKNCNISKNIARSGGGISIFNSVVDIENCLIEKNLTGGGIYFGDVVLRFRNCTFGIGNQSQFGSDVADLYTDSCQNQIVMRNSIVRKSNLFPCPIPTHRLIFNSNLPNTSGNGNIDADPLWMDPANGDYRLRINSPCIDAGTDTGLSTDFNGNPMPIDVVGVGIDGPSAHDMGAFEFQLSPADLDSNGYVNGQDLLLFQDQWQEGE